MANTKDRPAAMPNRMGPPGGHMGGGSDKAKDFSGTMKKLVRYMKPWYTVFSIAIIFGVGSTIFTIFGPKILGNATTLIFEGLQAKFAGTGGIDFSAIGQIMMFLAGMYVFSALLNYTQGWLMAGVAQRISYKMRKEISAKINRLPLKYYDQTTTGDVLSRVTNDIDTLATTLNQTLASVISNFTLLIGVIVMMLTISIPMTLVALVILPVSGLLVMGVVKASQRYFRAQQEHLGDLNGHVEEMYTGHNVIKVFNQEERSITTFRGLNKKLYVSAWRSQFFSSMMMPLMNMVTNFGYVVIVILGGFLTIQGSISVGDIQAFIQYLRSFTQPIVQTAQIANVLQSTAAAAERVFDFLEADEELADAPDAIE
ncbi:MAG: ABC transporter ATP-binding protein, partial [Erysipelotrichaceae bacterium]